MHEAKLRFKVVNPEIVKKSLEPDIKNDENTQTTIKTDKNFMEIIIKSKKLNYLKAIINSYISLVVVLEEAERIE